MGGPDDCAASELALDGGLEAIGLKKFTQSINTCKTSGLLFLWALAIKLVLLSIDHQVRLYMGDSATYLHRAIVLGVPPDRSFTYPLLIRLTTLVGHTLVPLLLLQTMCGVLTALIVSRILTVDFRLGRIAGATLFLAVCIEPAQLFYERMVMAECCGTLLLVAMLYCGFLYLRRHDWRWLLLVAVCGIAAVSLRANFVPVVIGLSVLPPLVAACARDDGALTNDHWRQVLAHLTIAALATASVHTVYRYSHAVLAGIDYGDYETRGLLPALSRSWEYRTLPPDYITYSGNFRLGLVAPLVKPAHLHGLGLPPDILERDPHVLADPHTREAQLWAADGLVALLRAQAGADGGNRLAGIIADRALGEDPAGLLRLAYSTTLDYFNPDIVRFRMNDDLGTRPPTADKIAYINENFQTDFTGRSDLVTPVYVWFGVSTNWLIFCLFALAPVAATTILTGWRHPERERALLLGLASLGLVAAHVLFSHIVSFRYLHPLPLFLLMNAGALIAMRQRRRAARRSA